MAMHAESDPIRSRLDLQPAGSPELWPSIEWFASDDESIVLARNGRDPGHGVDAIGTGPATITTLLSVQRWQPRWIVSAGTAGGFNARGGHVGQVIVADGPVIHHDRRIPLPGFDQLARGGHPSADLRDVATRLGFVSGPCSTGDSLDAPPADIEAMAAHGTLAKDMEAAAVAGVADRLGVRFTACKVITDIVDGEIATAEEFRANLATASAVLADAVPALLADLPA